MSLWYYKFVDASWLGVGMGRSWFGGTIGSMLVGMLSRVGVGLKRMDEIGWDEAEVAGILKENRTHKKLTFLERNIASLDKSYKMKAFEPSWYPMKIDFLAPESNLVLCDCVEMA